MLLTLDEHEKTCDGMRQVGIRSWDGVFLSCSEPLLMVRFVHKSSTVESHVRTILTTVKGLCKAVGAVLPATVLQAYAVVPMADKTCASWYASAEHTLTVAVRGMVQIPSP